MKKLNQKQLEALVSIAQTKEWEVLKKIMEFTISNLANQSLGNISVAKTTEQQIIENAYRKGQAYGMRMLQKEVDGAYKELDKLIDKKRREKKHAI